MWKKVTKLTTLLLIQNSSHFILFGPLTLPPVILEHQCQIQCFDLLELKLLLNSGQVCFGLFQYALPFHLSTFISAQNFQVSILQCL